MYYHIVYHMSYMDISFILYHYCYHNYFSIIVSIIYKTSWLTSLLYTIALFIAFKPFLILRNVVVPGAPPVEPPNMWYTWSRRTGELPHIKKKRNGWKCVCLKNWRYPGWPCSVRTWLTWLYIYIHQSYTLFPNKPKWVVKQNAASDASRAWNNTESLWIINPLVAMELTFCGMGIETSMKGALSMGCFALETNIEPKTSRRLEVSSPKLVPSGQRYQWNMPHHFRCIVPGRTWLVA